MNKSHFTYLKEEITADILEFIMSDFKKTPQEAFDILYLSQTFKKLTQPSTGLYFQSSKYVYSYLLNELDTGTLS